MPSVSPRFRLVGPALALFLALPSAGADESDGLLGTWVGRPVHQGREGVFALHLSEAEGEQVTVAVSLPPLGVYRYPVGQAPWDGTRLTLMGEVFTYDAGNDRLSGTLPAALVPIHRVPVELLRETLPPPSDGPDPDVPAPSPLWQVSLGSPVHAGLATLDDALLVAADDGCVYRLARTNGARDWQWCAQAAIRATPMATADGVLIHADDGRLYRLDHRGREVASLVVNETPVERIPSDQAGSRYDHFAAAPVVVDGVVYLGTHAGELLAIDAGLERVLWRHRGGDSILAAPAVVGDRVVTGSYDGSVTALDRHSGAILWQMETGAPVVSRPLAVDGRVVIGSRSYDLFALDVASGEPLWTFYYWYSWVESSARSWGGALYIGSSDSQQVYSLSIEDGSERWSFDSGGWTWASPAVSEQTVVVAAVGSSDYMVKHRASLTALDRASGRPVWQFRPAETGGAWGFAADPLIIEGRVYAADLDGTVHAFPERAP